MNGLDVLLVTPIKLLDVGIISKVHLLFPFEMTVIPMNLIAILMPCKIIIICSLHPIHLLKQS